jgi:hypothetical protein
MRQYRVGSFSFGLVLIGLGVTMLVAFFAKQSALNIIINAWPVAMIALGAEILIRLFVVKREADAKVKYDWLSIAFICVIIVISTVIYSVTAVISAFGGREELYRVFNIYPYYVTTEISEELAGAETLAFVGDGQNLRIIEGDGENIKVITVVSASTNRSDTREVENILRNLLKFEGARRVTMVAMQMHSTPISSVSFYSTVFLPKGKTVDLQGYYGVYNVSPNCKVQVLERIIPEKSYDGS